MLRKTTYSILITFLVISIGCKKPDKFVPCNEAPDYYGVPTVKVKNYINRIFIDLTGREPLDVEMDSLVILLENNKLNFATRDQIITSLQTDTVPGANGESYKDQYYQRMYELQKARFVEGLPDAEFNQDIGILENGARLDSTYGDMLSYQYKMNQAQLLRNVLESKDDLQNDSIDFAQMCLRMCYNNIYDDINMNSFNYVNAVFDNTFYRFPTQQEFLSSYEMVENSTADILFGQSGSSKFDFISIITRSTEFHDGTVNWVYRSYMAREPNAQEKFHYSNHYATNNDVNYIIKEIVKSDEYANF